MTPRFSGLLSLCLAAILCAMRPVGAEEKPASAVSYENPQRLTIAEILEKWQEATTRLPESGRLSFHGTLRDLVFDTEKVLHWELSWDGPTRIQLISAALRSSVNDKSTPILPSRESISLWSIGPDFFTEADLMADAFSAVPVPRDLSPVPTVRGGELRWWGPGWFPFPIENATALIGPGWICAKDEWVEAWEWTILRHDAGRIILEGVPAAPATARCFERVRWIIDPITWTVTAVQMTDPAGTRVTTLFRERSPWPATLSRPLITVDELKRRGFRNSSSNPRGDEFEVFPADALLPRNGWEW